MYTHHILFPQQTTNICPNFSNMKQHLRSVRCVFWRSEDTPAIESNRDLSAPAVKARDPWPSQSLVLEHLRESWNKPRSICLEIRFF